MRWKFAKAGTCLVAVIMLAVLVMPVAAQNRRAQGRPVVDLPRGPVRQVILDSCTACHGIDDYAYFAMDRAGWQKMIDSMKTKGANISDDNQTILLDWLSTKFGPDTKPFPRAKAAGPALAIGPMIMEFSETGNVTNIQGRPRERAADRSARAGAVAEGDA